MSVKDSLMNHPKLLGLLAGLMLFLASTGTGAAYFLPKAFVHVGP